MNPWLGWKRKRALLAELGIYASTSILLIQRYSREINAFDPEGLRLEQQTKIIAGDAADPDRFRILVPSLTQFLWKLTPFREDPTWLDRINFLTVGIFLFFMFWLIRVMLTQLGWTPAQSLVGPLLLAVLLPVAFFNSGYQPWSWLEAVTIPLIYILALRRSRVWLLVTVQFVSALNRETSIALVLIPLALLVANRKDHSVRKYFALAAAGMAIAWFAVRAFLFVAWPGPATERAITLSEIWSRNTDFSGSASLQWGGWLNTMFLVALFVGPVVVAAIVGVSNRAVPAQALWIAAATVPVYFAGWLVFALWGEVRVLLPMLIVAMPLVLAAFSEPFRKQQAPGTPSTPP